ncbi:uncharacterized protein LOC135703815 [Ochlerotatus camptorhynchus]|uniref:uncharacterized protein LOC135703815 n=1 Tax=Ochlerotatus camptorhynchus TaxID=644619 RepID=UPI0031D31CD2
MNINNFPAEVLEVIFFHLPLKDRKNASMVCRTWAQLAFSRPCLVSTELTMESSNVDDLSPLEISKRKYRNVCFRFDCSHFGLSQLKNVQSVLLKFRLTIERIRFVWDTMDVPFNIKLLLQILGPIPMLKELVVEDYICQYDEQEVDTTLEIQTFNNLEKLTIPNCLMDNVQFDFVKFAPNVKTVNITSSGKNLWGALQILGAQIQSMCIKTETKGNFKDLWTMEPYSLEKLHLHRLCSDLMEPRDFQLNDAILFFSQCRSLTVLGLELQVPIDVIQMIAQTCPMLKSLLVYEIEEGWAMIQILQQFDQLNSLTIRVAHFEVKPDVEKSQLAALRHLTLDGVEFENPFDFFHHLGQFALGLRELQFTQYDDSCNESYHLTVLKSIMQVKLPLLSRLVLVDNSSYFPSHVFNQFNLLPNLKELRLAYYGLSAWNRTITVPGIEKLSLDIYQLTTFQLRKLLKMFPSLVRLDVVEPEDPLCFCIESLPRTSLLCDFNLRKRGFNILDSWILA